MKNAIVVPHGGIDLPSECRESVLQYCERFGLDPVFLSEQKVGVTGHGKYIYGRFEKYQARQVLEEYERIMLLDADTIITDRALNIFESSRPIVWAWYVKTFLRSLRAASAI